MGRLKDNPQLRPDHPEFVVFAVIPPDPSLVRDMREWQHTLSLQIASIASLFHKTNPASRDHVMLIQQRLIEMEETAARAAEFKKRIGKLIKNNLV